MEDPKEFDIEVDGQSAHVTDHTIKSTRVLHIVFSGRRKPLNITVATNNDDEKFWTSVPEGRQAEAELAGKAVAAYIRAYRRQQACVIITDKKLPAPSLFD
jgi:adenine-specific DNA methylase